jgi:hypothetical protein
LFTGIRNGRINRIRRITTTAIPIHFSLLLMEASNGKAGRALAGA